MALQSSPQMAYTSEMSLVRDGVLPEDTQSTNRASAGFPDPFAVATINGEQTKTTQVSKRTLNPYWNESFDL
jgi:E3 ubiquitin-protein ligase NEDD4